MFSACVSANLVPMQNEWYRGSAVKKIDKNYIGNKELDSLYSLVNQDGNRKPATSISHTFWTI